jgi:LuxR family maltose regulon positive regulatory protein
MSRRDEQTISAGRRHIIERPRLTRILDEATAKVITLVAPAGYGKTTLARQWLAGRPHVWLHANEASSDVVALATAIGTTLAGFGVGRCDQLFARVRTLRGVDEELRSLAELQAQELAHVDEDVWFVLDDYEHIAGNRDAEEYVRLLLELVNVRFLIASRVSPRWATPRAVLYGYVKEIDRAELSMRPSEARAVLRATPGTNVSEIIALADGWPALVGLASLTHLDTRAVDDVTRPIFDYLAEELFHRCSRVLQAALPQLALAPRVTPELAAFVLGPRKGPRLLEEATDVGFFVAEGSALHLHPLLRRFLISKLDDQSARRDEVTERSLQFFMTRGEWDDAFELIRERQKPESLDMLCDAAYAPMLSNGRTSTLESWLSLASQFGLVSPIFDLIRAELALRHGKLSRAERIALRIVTDDNAELYKSRALTVAGRAAHLDDRESHALAFFQSAAVTAHSAEERHEATWGSLLSAQAMTSREEVSATLERFLAREPKCADDVVRAANARLMVALTIGAISDAVEFAQDAVDAIRHAHDPVIRTSFLNNLSRSLSLQARYAEAKTFADQLITDARGAALEFVLPYAYVAKAVALIGEQCFVEAESLVKQAEGLADHMDDIHNIVDARNLRVKLALTVRDFELAQALSQDLTDVSGVSSTMVADLFATRGLAQACAEATQDASVSLARAERLSSVPEVESLVACGKAVLSLRQTNDVDNAMAELKPTLDLGIVDPVIMICRACPEFELPVSRQRLIPPSMLLQLCRTSSATEAPHSLTDREVEVLRLLTRGYTNREIAAELVIAEVTAKVHVRNVIRKLGVRSRTEAAIAAVRQSIAGADE